MKDLIFYLVFPLFMFGGFGFFLYLVSGFDLDS